MAAINETNLRVMASSINNCAADYELTLTTEAKNMLDAFNNNWISTSAQELATEIKTCLESVEDAVTQTFSRKNKEIINAVNNFNMVENENIVFPGISFEKPAINMTLNSALPNGKVGVMDGIDLTTINIPMEKLTTNVISILNQIASTVQSADAFDSGEQAALTQSITSIKSIFESKMDELKVSLKTRMQQEISARDELQRANLNNLSS